MSGKSNKVKLPGTENAIVILFSDDLKSVRIDMTEYLWDILKVMAAEDKNYQFTQIGDGHKMTITVDVEKIENHQEEKED